MGLSKARKTQFAAWCAVALLSLVAASARAMDIDTFDEADTANQFFRLSGPGGTQTSPRLSHDSNLGGILGGERDVLVTVDLGPGESALPNSVMAGIGRPQVGLLEVATSGIHGTRIEIQYDGVDALSPGGGDSGGSALIDVLSIGDVDLTQGGTNDRLRFMVNSAQAQDGVNLEVVVEVRGPNNEFGSGAKFWLDSQTAAFYDLMFSDFQFAEGATEQSLFSGVQSIKFIFNPNFVANADFEIDSIAVVPEPSTLALAGLAGLAGIVCQWRKRRGK